MSILPMTASNAFGVSSQRYVSFHSFNASAFPGITVQGIPIQQPNGPIGPPPPGNCQCLDNGEMIVNNCNTAGGYLPWCDMARCDDNGNCRCYCLTQ